jgi:parvulin-like peptidyl-prolyl isomerase
MIDRKMTVASLVGVALPLEDWLTYLKKNGRLLPLLRSAVTEQFVLDHAARAGLAASSEELQQTANAFRQRHGLASAEQAKAWLAQQGLSVLDFEDAVERDVLLDKCKDHLTRDRIAPHFEANQADYARARLRLILVPSQDLGRELLAQIRDEGRDFADMAREHSQHPSRVDGGQLGLVMRRQLSQIVGDAVFAARVPDVIGPLASPQGFQLLRVEAFLPAQLDAPLSACIRQELFVAWLNEQTTAHPMKFPLLEALDASD